MPYISPHYPLNAADLRVQDCVVIAYTTSPEAIASVLPCALQFDSDESQVLLKWTRTSGSGLGEYTKCELKVPVRYKNERYLFNVMGLCDVDSVITAGREIYGRPFKHGVAQIKVDKDTLTTTVKYGSQEVVAASMLYKGEKAPKEDRIHKLMELPELNLKVVPSVEGCTEIAQLVRVRKDVITPKSEAWASRARINFVEHVNAPFADFPVRQYLGGLHYTIPEMKLCGASVLHDYLA
eukprot:TRINITY_DN6289_c0_g1_i2.p1 TRINITY_DN6289_c0_g1~~TRINITY_DN6289_c0_g1_i2.p1  ORF type:complete len:238 (+),score=37.10 TRINITY_DN6289_c0_g1_i2:419-1132(+)